MMTLSNSIFEENVPTTSNVQDASTNLDSLYCSHLWNNSCLRNEIITAPQKENQMIKYCYTCRGKIRKYDLNNGFVPNNHSTPNGKLTLDNVDLTVNELQDNSLDHCGKPVRSKKTNSSRDLESISLDNRYIPSISGQIDSSARNKYISRETQHNQPNRQRLRKSLSGVGCIVNFALTESPVKKRTQIQACSISVMIFAIVVISFILVNFTTPHFIHATNASSTIVVPTKNYNYNKTSSAITKVYVDVAPTENVIAPEHSTSTEYIATLNVIAPEHSTSTEYIATLNSENNSENVSSVLLKIRKNIRTYLRYKNPKPKEILKKDLSQRFCMCQKNEICCGGLCALETEACQLVDKTLGVRVCRLLAMVTCSPAEWRCRDGLCVPTEARCNGSIQCYDRSDELLCECDLTKQFQCGHSISCFENSKLCDGVIDCWDGFDEVNCTAECPREEFTCTDGQCILSSRFCDGLADCADGSDEPYGCDVACGAHEVRCGNHRCVSRVALCDGQDQCGDGTDELHCPK
ncbi:putative low-density lipoprotein receptor [Operophtera brumata]|uniref:Putative low-density lipoprotein receptor n=1 Tax=Operophtera brumata TaxID=104452 RepID=A0A0L7KQG3_OPEBR|nr:putative low-density lipoprotein receptor [Operophtera brumata]